MSGGLPALSRTQPYGKTASWKNDTHVAIMDSDMGVVLWGDALARLRGLAGNRQFLLLTAAQFCSNVGDWLFSLALFVLIGLRWHGSPLAVGFALVCNLLPAMLLGPVAGALADRAPRRSLMLLSNVLCALLLLALTAAGALWQIDALLAALGAAETLFSPAESGMLKDAVPDAEMDQAVAVRTAVAQGTKILGPALGGLLVALLGALAPFYVDAASFALAAVLTLFLRAGRVDVEGGQAQRPQDAQPFLQSAAEGLRRIAKSPLLRGLVGLYVLILFAVNLVDSQMIVLLRGQASAAAILGLSMTASGGGMAGAATLFLQRRRGLRAAPLGALSMGVGIAIAALAVAAGLPLVVPWAFLLFGVGAAFAFIPLQGALRRQVPPEWTGRVMGSVRSAAGVAVVAGPLLGGVLSEGMGAVREFLVAAALLLAVGAGALVLRYGREGEAVAEGVDGA